MFDVSESTFMTLLKLTESNIRELVLPTFLVLSELMRREDMRVLIISILTAYLQRPFWTVSEYLSSPLSFLARRNHFVGLVNPRCLCYMNSFLQQLFMISNFR
jgi:hypothetical protein